ncbi:MAG: hypothetical protein HC933_09140 [Pleurocapsa sp. SU_196_0]|nr:hypothetical protein [Pleurocapsa sp. SU_196_0]
MNNSRRGIAQIITLLLALNLFVLTSCSCWNSSFDVSATNSTGIVQAGQTIPPQTIMLFAPATYGNGCPPASNTVTSVDFYNGTNKLGTGTKGVNTFSFQWNITAGKDGIAATGVSEVVLTAVDPSGYRSPIPFKFSVQAP